MLTFAYFASTPDWLIIGGLIFILFGGQKIPEFARGLGEGLREFKKAMDPAHREEPVTVQSVSETSVASAEAHSAPAVTGITHEVGQPNR